MQQCCIRPEDFIIHKPINRNQAGNYYIEGFATGQTLHDGRSLQIMKKLVAVATQNSEKDCKVPFSNLATADDKREYNTMQYWLEKEYTEKLPRRWSHIDKSGVLYIEKHEKCGTNGKLCALFHWKETLITLNAINQRLEPSRPKGDEISSRISKYVRITFCGFSYDPEAFVDQTINCRKRTQPNQILRIPVRLLNFNFLQVLQNYRDARTWVHSTVENDSSFVDSINYDKSIIPIELAIDDEITTDDSAGSCSSSTMYTPPNENESGTDLEEKDRIFCQNDIDEQFEKKIPSTRASISDNNVLTNSIFFYSYRHDGFNNRILHLPANVNQLYRVFRETETVDSSLLPTVRTPMRENIDLRQVLKQTQYWMRCLMITVETRDISNTKLVEKITQSQKNDSQIDVIVQMFLCCTVALNPKLGKFFMNAYGMIVESLLKGFVSQEEKIQIATHYKYDLDTPRNYSSFRKETWRKSIRRHVIHTIRTILVEYREYIEKRWGCLESNLDTLLNRMRSGYYETFGTIVSTIYDHMYQQCCNAESNTMCAKRSRSNKSDID